MFYKFGDSQEEVKDLLSKHPDDDLFRKVLKMIGDFADAVQSPKDGEDPLTAKRHIEQGFDLLAAQLDAKLKDQHEAERREQRDQFVAVREAEIKARHLAGIIQNPQMRGQFACDQEIQYFRDTLKNNPDLTKAIQEKVEKQAVRQAAVEDAVGLARDEVLKRYWLDKVRDEPAPQTMPWEGEVKPRAILPDVPKRTGPKR